MNLKVLFFSLLIATVICRRHLKRDEVEQETDKTVVQSNHYSSEKERSTSFKASTLTKNEALIFVLKDTDRTSENSLADNPIKVELVSKEETVSCTFNTVHNMCSLKNIQQEEVEVKIECKKVPCELSWRMFQPKAIEGDGMHNIDELVEINKDYNHAMLVASCPDPNVVNFNSQLKLFTNSKYETVVNQNIVYYLFDSQEKGYYFITTEDSATKACVNVSIKHNPDEIKFNVKEGVMMDYILPKKINRYELSEMPETDFRMDAYYHPAKHINLSNKSQIEVSLIGQKGGLKANLYTVIIPGRQVGAIDFSIVFKRPTEEFKAFMIDITSKGEEIVIVNMDFRSSERQEVNLGQTSYFHLKAGEKINYKLIAQAEDTPDSKRTHIFSSDQAKFVPSLVDCKAKLGCEFTLEAKQEGSGNVYFGEGEQKNVTEEIVFEFKKSITKKLREGEQVLLKKSIKGKKAFQAVVNSPNVLIYAATKQKCPQISRACHQKILNSHNPFVYEPITDHDLYFLVKGLDRCQFTLTIIQEGTEYVKLRDAKPFTYLFDDAERQIKFQFKLDKKEDVNFNLIGPVNELNLIVMNGDKWDDDSKDSNMLSTDGYVSYKKDDINSLNFLIKVEKREQFLKKYIHFTVLASTTEGNVRLEPGISHFQNIKPEETRDFVFEFQPKKEILLNLYSHNIKSQIDFQVKVSTTDEYDKADGIMTFKLDSESQVIDLKPISEELCKEAMAQNCQLFVRVHNKMGVEVDLTLTLMIKDAIIEIKDGIWNSFKETEVAKTTHFFFLPKHQNKSVTILYQADFIDLKIMYTLWKTDDTSISPTQWPFPTSVKTNPEDSDSPFLLTRPTKLIHVDSEAMKGCWPNCVILLTVFEDKNGPKSRFNQFIVNKSFKIMASNNYIQIPEKQKVDIILKKDEEKHLLVDLKYVMEKNALTFFTYYTMGDVTLSGNVYDEENPRCPTADGVSDFRFGRVQTQVSVQTIKKKLQQNEMNQEKHVYMCILARADEDSKFSIEYDSNDEIITQLLVDSTVTYQAKQKAVKMYQADASQEFKLKITREAGFPFLETKLCKSGDDFESCLNSFKDSSDKGDQLTNKMTSIEQQPCEKCILFVKLTFQQKGQVNIHCQSKYVETELQEKKVLSDEVEKDVINKYIITAVKLQEMTINIQITHGDLQVSVNDFSGLSITKSNEGSNHILITVPPKNETGTPFAWGRTFLGAFAGSTFRTFHVQVKSKDSKGKAVYSISYSSGQPETYLQDGLISTFALFPNKTSKFLYKNPSLSKIYLHISATSPEVLNKFHIKILALMNPNDQESGVELFPEKTNFHKKTPNPTMVMSLPANKQFQIIISNENKQIELVTLGINNQEIIYLPFNHEFPVQLNKGEFIYIVINSPFQAFLDVEVKKCGESSLTLAYTTQYDQFTKEEFSHEQEMDHDQLTASLHIKTKTKGAVYVKLKTSPDEVSVVTIRALFSFSKSKTDKVTAGGRGIINYKLLDSKNALLQFDSLICPSTYRNCQKDFSFTSISSEKIEGIYAQLVCPSIAFDLEDRQILKEAQAKPITSSTSGNRISYQQSFQGDIVYVGVKALNNRTGDVVYYKPIEIATFWGEVQKNSKGNGNMVGIILAFLIICCILIAYRRRKKQISEYAPLASID